MKNKISIYALIKDTFNDWLDDKALRLSAALAYYAIFSIAPLLVISASIAGLIFGQEAVQGELQAQISGFVGPKGAETIQSMIQSTSTHQESVWAFLIGGVVLLVAAGGVFAQLKDALNTIWEVKPKPGKGIVRMVRDRFLSFTMVLGTGFLLLVSLVISTFLGMATHYVEGILPFTKTLWVGVNFLLSIGLTTILFAMIFRFLPDVKIGWGDVGIGALATAVLFELGKYLLGLYLGRETLISGYGAAGSVVLLLLWVYYASLILLLGAEFTRVYAKARGHKVMPNSLAESINDDSRKKEGMDQHSEPRKQGRLPVN